MDALTTSQNQTSRTHGRPSQGSGNRSVPSSSPDSFSSPTDGDGVGDGVLGTGPNFFKVIARDVALNQVASVLTEDEDKATRLALLWTRQAEGTGITVEVIRSV